MARQQRRPPANRLRLRHGVKALITAAGRVLLVKESHSDGSPFWTLPGGGIEPGESPPAALRREVREELCCRPAVRDKHARFWYAHASSPNALTRYTVFECALRSRPVPNCVDGILEARWVRPGTLPPETLLGVRHVIEQTVHG